MDKYDTAIEYLKAHPHEIKFAWFSPLMHQAGCLFMHLKPDNSCGSDQIGFAWGCPTQIRGGMEFGEKNVKPATYFKCPSETLTQQIRNDARVPNDWKEITLESLPVFAEYQRLADTTFRKD